MFYCNDSLDINHPGQLFTTSYYWIFSAKLLSSSRNWKGFFFLVLKKDNQIKNDVLLRPVSHATSHCTGLKPWLKPDIVIAIECIVQHCHYYYHYYYNSVINWISSHWDQ